MDHITLKQFLFMQPDGHTEQSSDKAYLRVANRLLSTWRNRRILSDVPDDLKKVVCLGLTGYFQDIVSDMGLYRCFTDEHKRLYGFRVPFHPNPQDYIDYELNEADVEFLLWYLLAFSSMKHRFAYPLEPKLLTLSNALYKVLEEEYDDIPEPAGWRQLSASDLSDPEDSEQIHDLSQWLFWKNWLLLPPFQLTFAQIYQTWMEIQATSKTPEEATERIDAEKQKAMASLPTGPLALYLREWLQLLLQGKIREKKQNAPTEPHPWYTAFLKANQGQSIKFLATYSELNAFLINALGWKEEEEHLPQMKNASNFVLMVTPDKGLMVAKDIAQCVKHPLNPLYDKECASSHAFALISQRGVCPGDMLRYFLESGCLPDLRFPKSTANDSDNNDLCRNNAGFLARSYLQEFFRGD